MPLNHNMPIEGAGLIAIGPHDRRSPDTADVVGSMVQEDSPVFSAITDARRVVGSADFYRVVPGQNVLETLGKEYIPDYLNGAFDEAYNQQAQDVIVSNIDRKRKNEEIIAASSWPQYLTGIAATLVTDPTNLIPGGAFVRGGRIGYSAAKSALSVGLAVGGASAASEAAL